MEVDAIKGKGKGNDKGKGKEKGKAKGTGKGKDNTDTKNDDWISWAEPRASSWSETRECRYCQKKGHLAAECKKKARDEKIAGHRIAALSEQPGALQDLGH